jgi:hypothetical protein
MKRGTHESIGKSDEWYTPAWIFEALGERFDMDVATTPDHTHLHVPTNRWIYADSLNAIWDGFIWLNPPFGKRNGVAPWLSKFFAHGDGIALTPDRTGCPWWQKANRQADATFFITPKVKFIRPDGSLGRSPANGTTLFATGPRAVAALRRADGKIGTCMVRACA